MNNSDKYPKGVVRKLDEPTIDKELLKEALSKPENIKKIMETNQRIMKELNSETDKNSIVEYGGVKCKIINNDDEQEK